MDAVSQLDKDDPDILSHRQQHLAEVFRLCMLLGLELNQVDLANTIDQASDVIAERRG